MNTDTEIVLSTLPGSSETERVLMVLCQRCNGQSSIELRQQSYAAGPGWFNQSTITLEPSQVAGLRTALGTNANKTSPALPTAFRRVESPAWQPRVVRADSA